MTEKWQMEFNSDKQELWDIMNVRVLGSIEKKRPWTLPGMDQFNYEERLERSGLLGAEGVNIIDICKVMWGKERKDCRKPPHIGLCIMCWVIG